MNLQCDVGTINLTIFGVGRDDGGDTPFMQVPAGGDVQAALREMLDATIESLTRQGEAKTYEPSEKHARIESLYIPTADDLATPLRQLHEAVNLPVDTTALGSADAIFSYFAQFTDSAGKRITALRRASQFKGILKSQNRLVRWNDDTLRIVPDNIFKLDVDFDLLIDNDNIHILRPSGFEFAGKLQQAILGAVPGNIAIIQSEIKFVDFAPIEKYACERPRAARYVASVRVQPSNENITLERLQELCKRVNVPIVVQGDKVSVPIGQEMAFLELLDRRRYEVNLTESEPEVYRAASRSKISG